MILYDTVASRHLHNDIITSINNQIGDAEKVNVYPNTTEDGTLYCLPETVYEQLKSKRTAYESDRREYTLSALFNIKVIKFPIAINVATMLTAIAKDKTVYGVLGYGENPIPVNLLHPLTPRNQLTEPYSKLVIYTYNDYNCIEMEHVNEELELIAYMEAAVQSAYQYKDRRAGQVKIGLYQKNPEFCKDPTFAQITSQARAVLPATETAEHGLIPHFLVTRGIYYPYYGASLYKMGIHGRQGYDLTAMVSANISASTSICIGTLPPSEYNSYRCLNCSNLDSPYRKNIMPKAYASIAEANKQFMLTILKGLTNESNWYKSKCTRCVIHN